MLFIIRSSDSARSQVSLPVYGPESSKNLISHTKTVPVASPESPLPDPGSSAG